MGQGDCAIWARKPHHLGYLNFLPCPNFEPRIRSSESDVATFFLVQGMDAMGDFS